MKRYKHNLSYYHLTTGNFGKLYPVGWWETLPGDSFRISTSVFTRCTPLLAPVMHPVSIRLHGFFCPFRLVDPDFEDFITGHNNTLRPAWGEAVGDELDEYLHLPDAAGTAYNVLKHPRLAYKLIGEEYYVDTEYRDVLDTDGLYNISYEKDFSTTARSDPASLSFGAKALVRTDGEDTFVEAYDVRRALAQQKFNEARSRYGTRYTEYLQYLGVKPADARLQRPEYIGGGAGQLNFSEVLSTVEMGNEPQGRLTGHGIAGVKTKTLSKYCEEHGIIMMLLSVRPKLVYQQGMAKFYQKSGFNNWYQKELELMGQQPVWNGEIYWDGTSGDGVTFGYQDAFYDLRRMPSRVSGEFKDIYDYWHMAPVYTNRPGLNSTYSWVKDEASTRCFADQVNDRLMFAINHKVAARRMVGPANRAPRTV